MRAEILAKSYKSGVAFERAKTGSRRVFGGITIDFGQPFPRKIIFFEKISENICMVRRNDVPLHPLSPRKWERQARRFLRNLHTDKVVREAIAVTSNSGKCGWVKCSSQLHCRKAMRWMFYYDYNKEEGYLG